MQKAVIFGYRIYGNISQLLGLIYNWHEGCGYSRRRGLGKYLIETKLPTKIELVSIPSPDNYVNYTETV